MPAATTGMKDFATHDEYLKELTGLIDRWCAARKLRPLSRLLPGYMSLTGLTDGWADLLDALKYTRSLGYEAFDAADWDSLNDLIHATDRIVYRR
jgi:hypothetical protein